MPFLEKLENVRKQREIKLVKTEIRKDYLVSKPNYDTTKFFTKKFVSNRNEKN